MLTCLRRGPASIARGVRPLHAATRWTTAQQSSLLRLKSPPETLNASIRQSFSVLSQARQYEATQRAPAEEADESETDRKTQAEQLQGRVTEFADLATRNMISPVVVDTITKTMGLKTMTPVQSLTVNESLKGDDM